MPQFDESKHPRAEDGKFTEKGNGTATSKKEKEYNPKGSSLKAGDSISYKEDTAYGGERRKGKIASIDGDTITTTDGKKINKFNAFKDEELEDVSYTDFLEDKTLKELDEYRKHYNYSVEDIDKGLDVRFKAGMNTKDAVEDLKDSMVALEDITKLIDKEDETYGVDDDFIRSYGPVPNKEEYPKEHQEYMDSYNKWQKNGDSEPIDEDVEVDLDYERAYGIIPDPEEEPEEYKKYIQNYKKWEAENKENKKNKLPF